MIFTLYKIRGISGWRYNTNNWASSSFSAVAGFHVPDSEGVEAIYVACSILAYGAIVHTNGIDNKLEIRGLA